MSGIEKERRQYARYHCVGIARLYSPAVGEYLDGVGQLILEAALHDMSLLGLSFDVSEAFKPGDRLYVETQQLGQPAERLSTEVRWCQSLEAGGYRVGVNISSSELIAAPDFEEAEMVALADVGYPAAVEMVCPACRVMSSFSFIATQELAREESVVMPLYNCSHCGTTRSLAAMLIHKRLQLLNSLKESGG